MIIDELIALLGYKVEGEEKLKQFEKGLERTTKRAQELGAAVGLMAGAAAAAAITGFSILGRGVIETSAKFEGYAATLETIEGSSEKAKKALDWVSDFAKTTPYEVAEVTEAFVKLRAYGMDPMDGTLMALGDTAAGMGKGLMQAVEALADAATGEFERLKEFGIKASTKGDQVTLKWIQNNKEMTKTVKKSGGEITKALKEIWGNRFAGAMMRQSKTWNGMISNLSDTWVGFQKRIGDAGFFDTVKNKLAGVMDTLAMWEANGSIEKISKALSSGFTSAANVVGTAVSRIVTHTNFLFDNIDRFGPWLKTFGIGVGLLAVKLFPVTAVLLLLGFAIEDFMTYLEGGDSVIGRFIEWLRKIIPASEGVQNAVMGLGAAVGAGLLLAFTLSPSLLARLVGSLVGALIFKLGPALVAGIATLSTSIAPAFAALFALLATPAGWAIILAGVAAALVAYFWDDLKALWDATDFKALGRSVGEGILAGLESMSAAIAAWFDSIMPQWVIDFRDKGGINSLKPDGGASDRAANAGGDIGSLFGKPPAGPSAPPVVPAPPSAPSTPGGDMGKLFGIKPGTTDEKAAADIGQMFRNLQGNASKLDGGKAAATVAQDNSTQNNNQTNNISTTVNQTIQQATAAPAAAANAVAGAVNRAAQPPRMNAGML